MTTCTECIIYIHGVSSDQELGHDKQYKALHSGIRRYQPNWPQTFKGVEWGWHPKTAPVPVSHELLSDAEHVLGKRALKAVDSVWDFTINPLRYAVTKFRSLVLYNFADMFYYVSAQGKAAVRLAMARQIVDFISDTIDQPDPLVSLTMLAHSAGSVVAFDFLFYLFYVAHKVEHFIDLSLIQPPSDASVIQPEATAPVEKTMSALQKLRELAQQDKLRIRRLYTFGSPITSTIFRSDAVLKILSREAGSNLLDVSCHGLNRNPAAFGQPLTGPRWINIWDKDDPIAWPVEPLMTGAGTTVIDKYLDVSDNPMRAHTVYWDNVRVHEVIGNSW